MIACSVY